MDENEKSGSAFGSEHELLADLFYKTSDDKVAGQKSI